jgi:hypothetical protein
VSAFAHHVVVLAVVDSDGVTVPGTADTFSVYCSLDEIGRRVVSKAVRDRLSIGKERRVRVTLDRDRFAAEVAS